MKRISAFEQKIRDYVNDADLCDRYFNSHPDQWAALCVAMDTLGDSCFALEHYEASGIGDEDGEEYVRLYGEKYLKLYGLLQAVFLQQDSIRELYRTFLEDDLQADPDSAWMRIRDLRNLTVGHPIEKRDKTGTKRCFLSRVTIHSGGFTVHVWDKDQGRDDFEDVDLKCLYDSYKSEALGYLEGIQRAQVNKWGALQQH